MTRPGRAARRRLPGGARQLRRDGLHRHARLPRVLGASRSRRSGLLRGRQAGRVDLDRPRRRRAPIRPAAPASFDYEGVPKRRLALLGGGCLPQRRPRRPDGGARRRRLDRSRSAGAEPVGAVPAPPEHGGRRAPREALIGGLDRGLLVTRFRYTNVVHPKQVIVTGMTRDGVFLIEDGRIKARCGTFASPRTTSMPWRRSRREQRTPAPSRASSGRPWFQPAHRLVLVHRHDRGSVGGARRRARP